jgi:hypothetical protein
MSAAAKAMSRTFIMIIHFAPAAVNQAIFVPIGIIINSNAKAEILTSHRQSITSSFDSRILVVAILPAQKSQLKYGKHRGERGALGKLCSPVCRIK